MLSETLSKGLEAYGIGAAIRNLRTEKDIGLEQLGQHTGLSASMLSRIERNQIFPTLPTLLRIAMVFGVGLEHFFMTPKDQPALAVVRRADRLKLPNTTEGRPQFHFESLDFPVPDRAVESYLAEFSGNRATDPHSHRGVEMIYVICGHLEVRVAERTHCLEEGDSMYFDASPEHSYRRVGASKCVAIVVVRAEVGT